MTLFRYELPVSVTLVSPFATRGLIVDRASIDLPLARSSEKGQDGKGKLILPGSLITGVLRAALTRLAQAAAGGVTLGGETRPLAKDIAALFGGASKTDEDAGQVAWKVSNEPDRGQLLIRDLVIEETSADKQLINRRDYPRIKLDEYLGSVALGFLQFVEMPFAIGEEITFAGTADLKVGIVGPDRAVALLQKAFALVPAVGAIKSAGFGRLATFTVGSAVEVRTPACNPFPASEVPIAIDIEYTIDRPFLVGGRMASANLFKGSFVIPGGAIKGALAEALTRAGRMTPETQKLLAAITIGHAFPRPAEGGKPRHPLPLSLAMAEREGRLFDRLLCDGKAVAKVNGRPVALAFQGDIKNDTPLKERFGLAWHEPEYDVRTRTKIDPAKGSAAFENQAGQLFSYAAVKPGDHVWAGRIVIPASPDPASAEAVLLSEILGFLKTGVAGLGKTGALITATMGKPAPVLKGATPEPPYALTLATPALLNDLEKLRQGRSLFDDYAEYWRSLGYRLIRFFARQELAGGYQALRYPPRLGVCEPYFGTDPGSVFLVEPTDDAIPLEKLLTGGLPPNAVFADRDWRTCPFLPENGFGQVLLDAVDHRALVDGIAIMPDPAQGKEKAA